MKLVGARLRGDGERIYDATKYRTTGCVWCVRCRHECELRYHAWWVCPDCEVVIGRAAEKEAS